MTVNQVYDTKDDDAMIAIVFYDSIVLFSINYVR